MRSIWSYLSRPYDWNDARDFMIGFSFIYCLIHAVFS